MPLRAGKNLPACAALLWMAVASCCPVTMRGADPATVTVVNDRANTLYASGEKATWTIDVKGERAGFADLTYVVKKDGQDTVAEGKLDLTAGPANVSATRGEPGALVLQIAAKGNPNKSLALGGAIFDWTKIGPSVPAPADFDEFWRGKLRQLSAIPMEPVLEKVDLPEPNTIEYSKVTLANVNGSHVRGQLARPKEGGKFPAVLIFEAAGVHVLNKEVVAGQARHGWLALNIAAHDLPIDESEDFYKRTGANELKDYIYIGSEDRETSYFLRMFLGCARAAEYLASRPDWDGKTLVVIGGSQGGLQSLATAALVPKVSAVIVCVPAGCDNLAPLAKPPRAFGWPYWMTPWGPKGRDPQKVQKTAAYFDGDYFAQRISCPTLVAMGLLDDTSRPAGVLAAFNAFKGPKELLLMTRSGHGGNGGVQRLFFTESLAWKAAIQAHTPLPIPPSGMFVD